MVKFTKHALDRYIIFCFIMMTLYAIAEFVTSSLTGITHDVLTGAWFGVHGGEIFVCAMIKRMKLKVPDSNGEEGVG